MLGESKQGSEEVRRLIFSSYRAHESTRQGIATLLFGSRPKKSNASSRKRKKEKRFFFCIG
jgi:hypothetical protein